MICHISSLWEPKLGKPAREFVDYLAESGFGVWQMLPLNPAGAGDSPYSSYAAFAGEARYVNEDELPDMSGYESFIRRNSYWLYDYIAYMLVKESQGGRPWYEWRDNLKFADSERVLDALNESQQQRANELAKQQYFFDAQWKSLKEYANSKGVELMGDLPIYMAADSADVWANKDIFRMDENGGQKVHAGVPPDEFTSEGQDWGNPLYDWETMKADGYAWWKRRVQAAGRLYERYDILRIDHFRGLSEYYAIPEGCGPKDGCWQHGPGLGFIKAIKRMLKDEGLGLKLLAEDLGFLDAGVKDLMKLSGLPGMDIWQFTAEEMKEMCEEEPDAASNRAFYTGTHDNNTLVGWLSEAEGKDEEKIREEARDIIRSIYESPACLAMMQLQDVFLLGEETRMNVPGVPEGNWTWSIPGVSLRDAFAYAEICAIWHRELASETGRLPEGSEE